jgi:hypothetical protein
VHVVHAAAQQMRARKSPGGGAQRTLSLVEVLSGFDCRRRGSGFGAFSALRSGRRAVGVRAGRPVGRWCPGVVFVRVNMVLVRLWARCGRRSDR